MSYRGKCLCGTVTYDLASEPFHFVICHCLNCKQSAGSAFMANAFFKDTVSLSLCTIFFIVTESPFRTSQLPKERTL